MVDYVNTFDQLGAEFKILRKTEALFEHSHLSTNATFSQRLLDAEYSSSVDEEDDAKAAGKVNLNDEVKPTLSGAHAAQIVSFEDRFFPVLDAELLTTASDISAGAIDYTYTIPGTGAVTILERLGRWGALRRQMISDSESILQNAVVVGALAADSQNTGVLSLTTNTGEDHTLAGTVVLEVTSAVVGATTLSVQLQLDQELIDGTTEVDADNDLTVGQNFEDGPTGLNLKLDLGSIVEAGDDGAMFSATTITNPQSGDTDNGKIYIRVTRQATSPIWLIEYFSDGSLTTLQGTDTSDTTVGTDTITITGSAGTIFSTTFDRAAAAVQLPATGNTDSDITFDIVNPREGDRWTIPVTNDEAGNFATKLARNYRASLNSVAAGNTIVDADAASVSMT